MGYVVGITAALEHFKTFDVTSVTKQGEKHDTHVIIFKILTVRSQTTHTRVTQ
jgi:hypothetical protein